jgi:hypothetical protein
MSIRIARGICDAGQILSKVAYLNSATPVSIMAQNTRSACSASPPAPDIDLQEPGRFVIP